MKGRFSVEYEHTPDSNTQPPVLPPPQQPPDNHALWIKLIGLTTAVIGLVATLIKLDVIRFK